jgi:DNA-binding MarR family transcriptional regulator
MPLMAHLNTTSDLIYQFILAFYEQQGVYPTQREIAKGCHLAHSSVYYQLNRLEAQGRIERKPGRQRSLFIPHHS